jgi:multifunctional 2-oxoglutarate metabolism enzyme
VSAQDFGANDWLVDEMYEQYLQDPSSVDPAWVEYFKTNKPGAPAAGATPSKGVPPIPKAQQQAPAPVAQAAPVAAAPVAAPVAQAAPAAPVSQPIVRETATAQPTPADPVCKACSSFDYTRCIIA